MADNQPDKIQEICLLLLTVLVEVLISIVEGKIEETKQVADMAAMLVLSGGLSAMVVALKYYVADAVESFVAYFVTANEYADDA